MKREYCKILMNENVIPETGVYQETTSTDFVMMAAGSKECTERNWQTLIGSVGLQIVNTLTSRKGVESLIECELT